MCRIMLNFDTKINGSSILNFCCANNVAPKLNVTDQNLIKPFLLYMAFILIWQLINFFRYMKSNRKSFLLGIRHIICNVFYIAGYENVPQVSINILVVLFDWLSYGGRGRVLCLTKLNFNDIFPTSRPRPLELSPWQTSA